MKEGKCEHARMKDRAFVCEKCGDPCAHQRFCQMKGRWVLTELAFRCPLRKEEDNG